jgi:acyl carrier protein
VTDQRAVIDQLVDIIRRVAGEARMTAEIDDNTALADGGFWLDSVEVLQVILACEDAFEITFVPAEDLNGETLKSLGSLAATIRRRRAHPSRSDAAPHASP